MASTGGGAAATREGAAGPGGAGSGSGGPQVGKSGKKICCSCPETRKARDMCMITRGDQEACAEYIEAHKVCLRAEGFRL